MKKVSLFILCCFVFFFVFPLQVSAQVVINEFSPLSSPDWIEVYNISTESADLSVYRFEDEAGNSLPLSGIISTNNFMTFDWSNRLNNDGDTFKLYKNSDVVMTVTYGGSGNVCIPSSSGSIAWIPDGGNTYDRLSTSTKGLTNGVSFSDPCPVPTPISTDTPTNTPTSTPSPTPTPVPTSTKTPTPTATKTPSPRATSVFTEESENLVLGLRDELTTPSPMPVSVEEKKKFPIFPVILIVTGFICIGVAGFFFYKNNVKKVS